MGNPEEESNPLLTAQNERNDAKKPTTTSTMPAEAVKKSPPMEYQGVATHEWAADGVPLGHGSVVGEPMQQRPQWDSSLFSCLGRNDEFCSSDLEVCELPFFSFFYTKIHLVVLVGSRAVEGERFPLC